MSVIFVDDGLGYSKGKIMIGIKNGTAGSS